MFITECRDVVPPRNGVLRVLRLLPLQPLLKMIQTVHDRIVSNAGELIGASDDCFSL